MLKDFTALVFKDKELTRELSDDFKQIYLVADFESLNRSLVEKDIDLIIFEDEEITKEEVKTVFSSYEVPFFQISSNKKIKEKTEDYSVFFSNKKNIRQDIQKFSKEVESLLISRENKALHKLLTMVRDFDISVKHVAKDFFIAEVKNFFELALKVKRSVWIDVSESLAKLPPILKLKQQLERQKVDHSGLLSDLDNCLEEVISEDTHQVWKHKDGKFVALVWLEVGYKHSQCLLLNGFEFSTQKELKSWFHFLVPLLNRRWNITAAVGEAQEQVYRDSLTNLYNQKFLDEVLERKIEENRRYKTPFAVLFIDVDHFKQVNDKKGHLVGSSVLKEMGEMLSDTIRNSDYAFRYGGDEFIILLSHTEGDEASLVAERIRSKVEAKTFEVHNREVRVTVSIGLALYPEHAQSAEEIVQIADEAMYYGKNKSRNVVYKAS